MLDYTPLRNTLYVKGISGHKLERELGLSHNVISVYLTGKTNPSLEIIDKITDYLGCDISDVVRYNHVDSIDNKVKRYEEELRMCFVSPPSELEEFIKKMVEAYRKGLED